MKQFIRVCDSLYGGRTCIYRYVNPNQIVEVHIGQTQYEVNVEALLTNGQRVIILHKEDLLVLVGEKYAKEIMNELEELFNESRTK